MIGRLTAEHDAIINATGILSRAAATRDTAAARAAARQLSAQLEPHTIREEAGLFAELRRDSEFTEHIDSLCAEHRTLDALLARVSCGDLGAATLLESMVRRHIDREENGLFPAAAIALDGETWDRIDVRVARLSQAR